MKRLALTFVLILIVFTSNAFPGNLSFQSSSPSKFSFTFFIGPTFGSSDYSYQSDWQPGWESQSGKITGISSCLMFEILMDSGAGLHRQAKFIVGVQFDHLKQAFDAFDQSYMKFNVGIGVKVDF